METRMPPSLCTTLTALLRAEASAYIRESRSLVWTVLVPLLILVLGELQVPAGLRHQSAPTLEIAALALTTGIFAMGLFGYANILATYRERGVFQRLRCTPAPLWQMLGARLLVQLLGIVAQMLVVFAAAQLGYGIAPPWPGTGLALVAIVLAGLAALALGQAVVAVARSAASVTAVSRFLLLALFLLEGALVSVRAWPMWLRRGAAWTPVRLALRLITAALVQQQWDARDVRALVGLLVWFAVLSYVGLTRFRWQTE
jgi:ABC-2 type transport system permease protein